MDYVNVEQARGMPGLRMVVHAGMPAPWSEAAKSIFKIKKIPYIAISTDTPEAKAVQRDWTGHTNGPVAVYESEPPRAGWVEILMLAERLQPVPALLPAAMGAKVEVLGLSQLICGEQGFGWNRRLMFLRDIAAKGAAATRAEQGLFELVSKYGYSASEAAAAAGRCAGILHHLAQRLHAQARHGSDYFVGDSLSAIDVYWATFAALVAPLPQEHSPMRSFARALYTNTDPVVAEALDPVLLNHRDRVYQRHIGLPLDY